ncbi:MAG: lipopolysaccharide biosynthesis protein [Hydrogenophaga sp.]|jgi:O-antigen/teichoic acid export membrane protein|nr:lipopolysaccharide biosynthesis protein [Hydrogenophaga sp.]
MTTVRRALALSFLERYLSIVLALASNMILARLLTPHEIGQYSVTLAVIGIAHVLRDFGIGSYLIQERELSDSHICTAFGVSLLLGGGLFLVVYLAAPWAARFYGEAAMTQTMRIASLSFLVLPFCTVRLALLRRAMRFKPLLYVSLGASSVSLATTVLLAWRGWGADSMAIGAVVLNLATAAGTWLATKDRRLHRPSLALWRPVLNFGGQSAATSVVTTLSMDANDLVVGKVMGFQAVAMISRAQGVVNLFHRDVMGAVRNVAMPAFAQAHRGGDAVDARFRHSLTLVTSIAWPFYGLLSLYALEALRLLFGPQWDAAAPLVPLFALAGAFGAINSLVPTLLIAVGRIDLVTRTEFVVQPLRLLLVLAAAIGFRSMEAVALAFLGSAVLTAPIFLAVGNRGVPGLAHQLWHTLKPSAVVSACVLLPAGLHLVLAGGRSGEPLPLAWVFACVTAGVALGVLAAERIRHPLTQEPAYRAIRKRLRFGGPGEPQP